MRFEQFIRERRYLRNVSPRTIEWYENSFRWLPSDTPTQEQLNEAVIKMREKGLKATGCDCAIRAINAYLKWSSSGLKIRPMKEPKLVLPTFTESRVKQLVAWKPEGKFERCLSTLVLFLLDKGCRIAEALTVRVREVDFDNMLVTLDGKGRKQRIVPFSLGLRKALFRHCEESSSLELLFANGARGQLGVNNMRRDVKALCTHLGFTPPLRTLHSFRHTFAVNYLRRGGSVFHLQKVLGIQRWR